MSASRGLWSCAPPRRGSGPLGLVSLLSVFVLPVHVILRDSCWAWWVDNSWRVLSSLPRNQSEIHQPFVLCIHVCMQCFMSIWLNFTAKCWRERNGLIFRDGVSVLKGAKCANISQRRQTEIFHEGGFHSKELCAKEVFIAHKGMWRVLEARELSPEDTRFFFLFFKKKIQRALVVELQWHL